MLLPPSRLTLIFDIVSMKGFFILVLLSKHVLPSRRLSLNTRTLLAQSYIFAKPYSNLAIWCSFADLQIRMPTVFHMHVCRKMYRFNRKDPVSDDKIQSSIRLLPSILQLRKSRLLYLGRLFSHGPP